MPIAGNPSTAEECVTADLFVSEGHQAVRLPQQFRIEADRVTVRLVETGILIEPLIAKRRVTREELNAWWARLERHNELYGPFMPEGREQPPMPEDGVSDLFD